MQIWIVLLIAVLGGTELLQWVQGFSLPLPILCAAGIALAIASNKDKQTRLPWRSVDLQSILSKLDTSGVDQISDASDRVANPLPPDLKTCDAGTASPSQPRRSPELPTWNTPVASSPAKSISFTIRKSELGDGK
jgi:hypothetical protein